MFAPYFTISPDAIRYGHAQGTNGAQFWPYTIMLINDKVAPPTIAGTIFVINNEMNTNGENVKNNVIPVSRDPGIPKGRKRAQDTKNPPLCGREGDWRA